MIVLLPGNHAFNFKVLTPSQSSTIHKNICLNLLLNIGIQTFVKSIHLMTLTADNTKHINLPVHTYSVGMETHTVQLQFFMHS